MTLALVLGGAFAVACVLFVARTFLREPSASARGDVLDEPGPLGRTQLALAEERDRALAALKELEFDHRTGKVSDEDYRALVGPLRRAAAAALVGLGPRGGQVPFPAMSESPTIPEPAPYPQEPPGRPVIPEPSPMPPEPPITVPVSEPPPGPLDPPAPQTPGTV